MRPQQVTQGASGASAYLVPDNKANPFSVSIACVVNGGGTLTYKVQHTMDDPSSASPTWFDHSSITGKTANQDGNYAFPVLGIRVNVTAYTSGSVTMNLIQSTR